MTIIIILITGIFSYIGFSNPNFFTKYLFNAPKVLGRKEYIRLLTHGFLHADWMHLIVNMMVLYSFGAFVESIFLQLNAAGYIPIPRLMYVIFYISAILVATLPSLLKHKNDTWYNSIGASGAVSAVVFAAIFFNPKGTILFFGILPLPSFIYGILYLFYESYMNKRGGTGVAHDAHITGAAFGFTFPILIDYELFWIFWDKLTN